MLDSRLDDGLNVRGLVVRDPVWEANLAGLHVTNLDGIATEKIGDNGEIAIVGELVGKQLAVDEDAENVREDDDSLLGVFVVLGVSDVGLDYRELATS